jgi:hypothetical protein
MLFNIRGTHGSGKTTLVRNTLVANDGRPIFAEASKPPEAYEFNRAGKTTFILGCYETPCGGLDTVQPYNLICPLIERYARLGDVIFEGALISSCWGAVGQLLESWGRDAIVSFMDTPVDVCIARVRARRAARGDDRKFDPTNLIAKHEAIARLQQKLDAAGIVQTSIISWT